jgi:hypothetical protein
VNGPHLVAARLAEVPGKTAAGRLVSRSHVMDGPDAREWARTAWHEAGHAVVLAAQGQRLISASVWWEGFEDGTVQIAGR